ncbi:ImmA/IrrE family metallo-endopeptidase [Streptomyces sp. NBC_01187]|uniref:ImmA/IrrE family metallo-endopeptidase n=1 Tax=Streptomyces sp. NBC_01187 TaxID=2903766 RepID=UPI003868430C|nr:ImmA/IrrE family metallo-endopeptidase [Streptomyces sp. NBC_01187]
MTSTWRWKRGQQDQDFRRKCEERVRALGLPEDLTIDSLCERLSLLRERPLDVMSYALPLGYPDGLLIQVPTYDVIVYEERLAPVHQRQVFFHELGHLICEHATQEVLNASVTQQLLPSLDGQMVRRVLGRSHHQSAEEREAEYVGSIIGRRIGEWSQDRQRVIPPEARELVARLSGLEHPSQRDKH